MISKRLRYEILRRDNHACRYCGRTAPEVKLTVDHVIPAALGGGDDPTNLVTACADCNAGKTSTAPDAPLVADVAQDALRWAAAMTRAAAIQAEDRAAAQAWVDWFATEWARWGHGEGDDRKPVPLPHDWAKSVARMLEAGASGEDFLYAIETAMASWAEQENKFRYTAGVIWRLIEERQQIAKSLLTED